MTKHYKLHQEYRFQVPCYGRDLAVRNYGNGIAVVEDVRKNGQADCHMSGGLMFVEGKWVWDRDWRQNFTEYAGTELADQILEYLNKYPEWTYSIVGGE